MTPVDRQSPVTTEPPAFAEALRFWSKLGWISFGGPAGQIAIMQSELVERKAWIGRERFLHALNFCMLLPGPEAQQLAIYIGWLLHGTRGGVAAGLLFILPSVAILWVVSVVYVTWGTVPWIGAVLYGLKAAVLAVVMVAVIRIGTKALTTTVLRVTAFLALAALSIFDIPFPLVMLSAAAAGAAVGPRSLVRASDGGGERTEAQNSIYSTWSRALRITAVSVVLWWAPIIGCAVWLGSDHTLVREGVFFSKAAMVTFGGAYAVLPYVSQQAIHRFGWVSTAQMLDGLGLAESTPGPLIMVLQFVGFLGAYSAPMGLPPLVSATLGALMTTWCTFVPCFLWVLVGAPHIERLRGNRRASAALSAITAAVVGVVANLAVWFGFHVLVTGHGTIDWFSTAVWAGSLYLMIKRRWRMTVVLAAAALAGVTYHLAMTR